MMELHIQGMCSEHDPPHVVDLITDRNGGDWPEAECGILAVYDVTGECDCGEFEVDGEYSPAVNHYMPYHECPLRTDDEDEDEE